MRFYILANAFIFGSLIGSFLNVVILRMPIGKSIVTQDLPVLNVAFNLSGIIIFPFSKLSFLKGKCSNCGSRISFQYPLIEFICGITATIMFPVSISESSVVYYLIYYAIFCSLLAQFVIDIQHHLLLDKINLFLLSIILPLSIINNGAVFTFDRGRGWFSVPIDSFLGFFF